MKKVLQEKYYLIHFRILQEDYYTFWYTDDKDGFLLDTNGMLKFCSTKEEAAAFAEQEGFLLDTDALLVSSAILRRIHIRKIKMQSFF